MIRPRTTQPELHRFGLGLPLVGRIAVTGAGLVLAVVGYTYPVMRYQQRADTAAGQRGHADPQMLGRMLLGACLSGVALLGTWGSTQWAAKWAGELTKNELQSREWTQIWLAIGACVGVQADGRCLRYWSQSSSCRWVC